MPSKRVFFLGAFAALAASGADARALLQEPGAVAADPADLACGACKKFVAEGEEYINEPSTLEQVGEEIKKLLNSTLEREKLDGMKHLIALIITDPF